VIYLTAVSCSDYTAMNDKKIKEYLIENDIDRSGYGLIGDFSSISPNKMETNLEEGKGYSCCLT
jgi:hypothetical protein